MEVLLLMSAKEVGPTPTHTPKLSDDHTPSLLTSWHFSTTAHVTTESVPPLVAEEENVLFLVHDLPENLIAFARFKGLRNMKQGTAIYTLHNNLSVTGPAHSGRETIYHNGSLLLENTCKNRINNIHVPPSARGKVAARSPYPGFSEKCFPE
ncbi:hypothetical protein A6R68_06610, partial [Neotoma lepida]